MPRLGAFASIAVALFVAISISETLRADEPVTFWGLTTDLVETAALAAAVFFTAFASTEARALRRERRDLLADLDRSRNESARWRCAAKRHVEGLSRAIAEQFRAWGLTEAEADIATLMSKGLSHKEIAILRGGSEATVRQHAARVYAKSGFEGRAQLTAFFLEDLLAPDEAHVASLSTINDETDRGAGRVFDNRRDFPAVGLVPLLQFPAAHRFCGLANVRGETGHFRQHPEPETQHLCRAPSSRRSCT